MKNFIKFILILFAMVLLENLINYLITLFITFDFNCFNFQDIEFRKAFACWNFILLALSTPFAHIIAKETKF